MPRSALFFAFALVLSSAAQAAFAPISVSSGSANGHTCQVVTWTDSSGQPRSAWISTTNHKITRLTYVLGGSPVTDNEVTGYGLGNLTNHGSCGATVTRLGTGVSAYVGSAAFAGPNHYIWRSTFRFNMCGSGAQWRINNDYLFINGRDDFLQTVAYDSSDVPGATAMNEDMRGPYNQMNWGGNTSVPVTGIGWGDHYKFRTTGPFTPDVGSCAWDCAGTMPWEWNQPNTIPYVWLWKDIAQGADIDREYGVVQNQRDSEQDFGGAYYGSGNVPATLPAVSAAPHRMFDCWAAPTQMNCYDSPWRSGRMTWGSTYGTFQNGHANDRGAAMTALPYRPINAWSWLHHVGRYSDGKVQALVSDTENIYASTLSAVSPAAPAASGPRGPGNYVGASVGSMPIVSYPKAGYDFVYRAWTLESAGQNTSYSLQVPSGRTLHKPLSVLRQAPGLPCRVSLDGVDLVADVDYAASYEAGSQKLWLTLNSTLGAGTRQVEVYFSCGSPTPTRTPCAACTATPTVTATPTASSTPSFCTLTLYNGEAGASGGSAWAAPAPSSIAPSAAAAHSGAMGMSATLNWTGWWGGLGYNWANYTVGAGLDLSQATALEIWFRAPSGTVSGLYVSLADDGANNSVTQNVDPNLQGGPGVTSTWKKAVFPMSGFTGIDLTKVWEINIGTSAAASGIATFEFDDVQVILPCPASSPTPTATAAMGSPTASPSATGTASPSASPSATRTSSPSATLSPSPTPSATTTTTVSPSSTATETPDYSPTVTMTPTDYAGTPTSTETATETGTRTATAIASSTPSDSPTSTRTNTPSPSGTSSPSATASVSPGPSGTATPTASSTALASSTSTPSATRTWTATVSASSTTTATGTLTAGSTPAASATATRTATPSPTAPAASSPTPTSVAADATLGPVVQAVVPYPNPNPRSLRVQILGLAESLDLDLYTKAMVLGASSRAPGGSGWVNVALPGEWAGLPAGLYFVKVTAHSGKRSSHAGSRLLVLR